VRALLKRRIVLPLAELLRQGLTPESLALSLALGAAFGVFPVLGSTMLLCTFAALLLRLNPAAIQIANYAVYPLQLLLLMPFMRLGAALFGGEKLTLTTTALLDTIRNDVWLAISSYWDATLHAIGAWVVAVPLPAFAVYLVLRTLLRRSASRLGRGSFEPGEARSACST